MPLSAHGSDAGWAKLLLPRLHALAAHLVSLHAAFCAVGDPLGRLQPSLAQPWQRIP